MSTPAPVPWQVRLLVNLVKWSAWAHLTYITYTEGEEFGIMQWNAPYELRELTVSFTRNVAGKPVDDAAMITFHLLNITGGDPDSSWTTSDYTTAEGFFDTWWNSCKPYYRPEYILSEYAWRADGPLFKPHGDQFSPILRRTQKSVPGTNSTSTQSLPPQVALSVTERTSAKFTAHDVEGVGDQLRNRWGRFYMPAPSVETVAGGRPTSSLMVGVATATDTLYAALVGADLHPVMYSPTTGSSWSVDEISVDDIFDVIRSRRYRTVTAREVRTTV